MYNLLETTQTSGGVPLTSGFTPLPLAFAHLPVDWHCGVNMEGRGLAKLVRKAGGLREAAPGTVNIMLSSLMGV